MALRIGNEAPDFSAETTLTADTVPVKVDAIAFWMVWDAQKAVLEVDEIPSAALRRLVDEVRTAKVDPVTAYNRTHNRHNRGR